MRLISVALTLTMLALPAFAQSEEDIMSRIENIHGDSEGFGEAFGLLQDAFLFGDPTAIADLAEYPLTVSANSEVYDILEPQDLVDNFDSLLTQENHRRPLQPGFRRPDRHQRGRRLCQWRPVDDQYLHR